MKLTPHRLTTEPYYHSVRASSEPNEKGTYYLRGEVDALLATPIPMILFCPSCGLQHIDGPDGRKAPAVGPGIDVVSWTNPPHRSHLCNGCEHIWRPADVPTNGVASLHTIGKADSFPALRVQLARPVGPGDVLQITRYYGKDEE